MVGFHRWLATLVLTSCACTNLSAAGIARLTLSGEPGDYVVGAQNFDIVYTPQNSFYFSTFVDRTIVGPPEQPTEIEFELGTITSGADNTFAFHTFKSRTLTSTADPRRRIRLRDRL